MTSDPVKQHILSQFGKRQMISTQSLAEAIREHREACVILAIKASQSDADGEKIRAELDAADDKLLSALSSHAETAGMVMVPVEPTEAMLDAGWKRVTVGLTNGKEEHLKELYRAMIKAAKGGEK